MSTQTEPPLGPLDVRSALTFPVLLHDATATAASLDHVDLLYTALKNLTTPPADDSTPLRVLHSVARSNTNLFPGSLLGRFVGLYPNSHMYSLPAFALSDLLNPRARTIISKQLRLATAYVGPVKASRFTSGSGTLLADASYNADCVQWRGDTEQLVIALAKRWRSARGVGASLFHESSLRYFDVVAVAWPVVHPTSTDDDWCDTIDGVSDFELASIIDGAIASAAVSPVASEAELARAASVYREHLLSVYASDCMLAAGRAIAAGAPPVNFAEVGLAAIAEARSHGTYAAPIVDAAGMAYARVSRLRDKACGECLVRLTDKCAGSRTAFVAALRVYLVAVARTAACTAVAVTGDAACRRDEVHRQIVLAIADAEDEIREKVNSVSTRAEHEKILGDALAPYEHQCNELSSAVTALLAKIRVELEDIGRVLDAVVERAPSCIQRNGAMTSTQARAFVRFGCAGPVTGCMRDILGVLVNAIAYSPLAEPTAAR